MVPVQAVRIAHLHEEVVMSEASNIDADVGASDFLH